MAKQSALNSKQTARPDKEGPSKTLGCRLRGLATPALLMLLSVVLLTLAFAPFGQFYLAWVGLVPWLWVVRSRKTNVRAFFWAWAAGTVFFIANMWWMTSVTIPGTLALMPYCGLYWALVALVLRCCGLLEISSISTPNPMRAAWRSAGDVLAIAAVWVCGEWLRGTLMTGLPWLYLGHTQTPFLPMCQVADFASAYGVSFWVVAVNAFVLMLLIHRMNWRRLWPAGAVTALLCAAVFAYGLFRQFQKTTTPGPTLCVVQPDYPQDNGNGDKGGTIEGRVQFHIDQTLAAVKNHPGVDLVAWSETMMPELNPGLYRQNVRGVPVPDGAGHVIPDYGAFLDKVDERLANLAHQINADLLVGGSYIGPETSGDRFIDRRNSAYFFTAAGRLSRLRYDKIHLVPFGEFIPFKKSLPWLYQIFLKMSPYDFDYTCTPGDENALTVFPISPKRDTTASTGLVAEQKSAVPVRFVVPICFEDIDSPLVARMFRPGAGSDGAMEGAKRADLIVNITNDGWFKFNEMPQHMQVAVFRSIENRVPTARSVNTGISGFIDSFGRISHTIPAGTIGAGVARVSLDSRLTLYTRFGDIFACLCSWFTALLIVWNAAAGRRNRRSHVPNSP